jgi:hypothetical protein
MSKSKDNALLLTLTVMITGLSVTGLLQPPQIAYSQQDYEEYIIIENVDQRINQQNIASGSSTNINCGLNTAGTNLAQPITTCPSIPGETPSPGIAVRPVVTQRVAEIPIAEGSSSVAGEAQCNSDEVVTGGGYEISELDRASMVVTTFKEFAANNAWRVEITDPDVFGTMRVFAECLKLVPA